MSQPTTKPDKNETSGDTAHKDEEHGDYDPAAHRNLAHPTNDLDTFAHLLKGCLGSGVFAMPMAFRNSGLLFGLCCTIVVGFICTYCVYILVKSAQALCRRCKVPSLSYDEVAETAFLAGPERIRPWAKAARFMINLFLCLDLLGCCSVYVLFVTENMKQVIDNYTDESTHQSLILYMVYSLPFLIAMNLIRNLKYLAPLSMVANILIGVSLGITYSYLMVDIPSFSSVPQIVSITRLPVFFGTAIFALEGIGVVMPLENNMKTPSHFIGCPISVLNLGMSIVVFLYATTGFFGFLKYGEETQGSISLNVPRDTKLGQSVKLMIALAIFFTYALQFYVPMEIIWKSMQSKFPNRPLLAEYCLRIGLVTSTVVCAIVVPNLGAFLSLVGAVCLSMLGLIFPSIIDICTFYEDPGFGRFKWKLYKDMFLIVFGVIGFTTGTYVSMLDIIKIYTEEK